MRKSPKAAGHHPNEQLQYQAFGCFLLGKPTLQPVRPTMPLFQASRYVESQGQSGLALPAQHKCLGHPAAHILNEDAAGPK